MSPEERTETIRQIHGLACKLGAESILYLNSKVPKGDDEGYAEQIHVGFAVAVAEAHMGFPDSPTTPPTFFTYWLSLCVMQMGYDPNSDDFESIRADLEIYFGTHERDWPGGESRW